MEEVGEVNTTVDTTVEEDDDPLDTTDTKEPSHRVGKKGMIVIDMKGNEILLNEEVRVVEAPGNESTEESRSITHQHNEMNDEADKDNTEKQAEPSPNF